MAYRLSASLGWKRTTTVRRGDCATSAGSRCDSRLSRPERASKRSSWVGPALALSEGGRGAAHRELTSSDRVAFLHPRTPGLDPAAAERPRRADAARRPQAASGERPLRDLALRPSRPARFGVYRGASGAPRARLGAWTHSGVDRGGCGGALPAVDVQAIPPTLAARDRLREAQADQILVRNRAMSVQTLATRHGLDAEKEQQLIGEPVVDG